MMSGWLIALIVVAALFIAGGICCKTIGRKQAENMQNTAIKK